jgi:negative regulator of sigma-B (phosphoserine phosphatase)
VRGASVDGELASAPARESGLRIDVGTSIRPIVGETEAGDAAITLRSERSLLVALADGLGHGPRAALAAREFLESVTRDAGLPLEQLFLNAHRALTKTRGAVASIVRIDELRGTAEVGAIGNVAVSIVRAETARIVRFVSVPAVLGSSYRPVRPETVAVGVGDAVVMHTDGVHTRFDFTVVRSMNAQAAAEHVIRSAGKSSDDAACVILQAFTATSIPTVLPAADGEAAPRVIPIRIQGDAECLSNETRTFAQRIGMPVRAQWEAAIVASELATNVLKFANKGVATIRHVKSKREALMVEIVDDGSGIPDIGAALLDGYSGNALLSADRPRAPGKGLGVGLGTVHRLSDLVTIESEPNRGTKVTFWKYLPLA